MPDETTQRALSVFVLSDVRIFREGIASSLGREEHFTVIEASTVAPDCLQRVVDAAPDVVVIDTASGADAALVAALREFVPAAKLIAFGVREDEDEIVRCAETGFAGYVGRGATCEELVTVIGLAQRCELVCSSRVAATLFRRLGVAITSAPPAVEALTVRERQVRALIQEGCANKEIASRLGISVATVKNHVHHILEKLHVDRRAHAGRADRLARMDIADRAPARNPRLATR